MKGLKNKVVVVTGAAGVIGSAIARRFAEAGAKIGVFDIDDEGGRRTARQLDALGGQGLFRRVDITDYEAVRYAVAELESALGSVDVLVNNAGWDRFQPFVETTPKDWDKLIAVNLRGPLHLHHAIVPGMISRGAGRIVNISSDAARVGSSGEAIYSACKGGIIAFSKTLAREVARQRITVNVVCPGPTDTPILRSFVEEGAAGDKVYKALERAIPFKRIGQGEDIAGVVAFLASDEANYITGQVISVSGGLTMAG